MKLPEYLDLKRNREIAILAMVNKTNILTPVMMDELMKAFNFLDNDPQVKIIVFTGNGAKSFIAGADIKTMQSLNVPGAVDFITMLHTLIETVRSMKKLVIAAVNGHCYGGGLELAICCDLLIAAESATFGMQEVALGIPSVIEASLFPMMVGLAKTREWLFTGNVFDAREAYESRLVNRIVPGEKLMEEAMAWAQKLANNPPNAIALQKRLMNRWLENAGLEQSIKDGIDSFGLAFGYDETRNILANAFKK